MARRQGTPDPTLSLPVREVVNASIEAVMTGEDAVRTAAHYRISMEGWLKIELMRRLLARLEPVYQADSNGTDDVDITIAGPGGRVRIELKTLPTNFGEGGQAFSTGIKNVGGDIEKLVNKCAYGDLGLAIWLAYPVPHLRPPKWGEYRERVDSYGATTLREAVFDLGGGMHALLHVEAINAPRQVIAQFKDEPREFPWMSSIR